MSLSGKDEWIVATFSISQIETHDAKFMLEVEAAVTHPNVEHVYLSGHLNADVLLPYIALLHRLAIPFSVLHTAFSGGQSPVAIEVVRDASL